MAITSLTSASSHPVLHVVAHHGVDISSVAFLGPLLENLLVSTLRQPLSPSPSSSNEHHFPAVIVPDGDRQDETEDNRLESMRTRKTATRIDSKISICALAYPIQEVLDLPVGLFNVRKYMRPAIHSSISWMVSVEDLQVRPCLLDLISKGPNT